MTIMDGSAFRVADTTAAQVQVQAQVLRRAWLDCHARDCRAGIETHPNVALAQSAFDDDPPLVLVNWDATDPGKMNSVAVLEPDEVRTRVFPGVPWRLKLRGRQLVGNVVLGADFNENSVEAFLDGITEILRSRRADSITIDEVALNSPMWRALSALRRRGLTYFHDRVPAAHSYLDFPEKPEDYWKKISNKTRKRVRKQGQDLKTVMVHYRTPEGVQEFLNKANAICAKSWQGLTLGKRIGNDPKTCAYWTEIAKLGAMRSYTLEIDGVPIAFQRSMQWNGTLVLDQTGYDPAYHPHSPGTMMMHQIIDDLIADNTPRRVDFGQGDFPYKRYFGTTLIEAVPVIIVPRRMKPLGVMLASRINRDAHVAARRVLERLNLFSKVKNKLYRNRATGQ
jgi:hypothetical protein